jgi:hypothetical protein
VRSPRDELAARLISAGGIFASVDAAALAPVAHLLGARTQAAGVEQREQAVKESALHLHVPARNFGMLEFDALDRIVAVGYEHARQALASWPGRERFREH